MPNLATLIDEAARRWPDRDALVLGSSRLTYAEVAAAVSQVAGALAARGVTRGDVVALACPNLPAFTIAYYGILKAGAAVVPLNVLLKAGEIAYHLQDSGATAFVCFEGTDELPLAAEGRAAFDAVESCAHFLLVPADPLAPRSGDDPETLDAAMREQPPVFETTDVDDDDVAVILYTSGTTGQPKGAELRHRNMRDNALLGGAVFGVDSARPDVFLAVLPLFHSFGQTVVQNFAMASGGTVVMLPRFDAQAALRTMRDEAVTFFAGVPTMYWGLLGAADDADDVELAELVDRLRICVAGGSALPVELHRDFESRFGVRIQEGYGLSETSPVVAFAPQDEALRVGSIGRPVPGVEMRLLEPGTWDPLPPRLEPDGRSPVGEIAVRGHNVMRGYRGRPEATAQVLRDGWFRTGDLARVDADGFYYIVDRAKEMIIRGGYNVYPREVEETLLTHPQVSLVAVIGVPHPTHGEEVAAVVIRVPGATLEEADLVAWARERMASYKYPRVVRFVEQLPMTATGKILKRELA